MERLGTDAIWAALKHHPTFAGCFPADKIPHVKSFPTAFIVNTEKYGEEGEHWVAFYIVFILIVLEWGSLNTPYHHIYQTIMIQ